MKDIGSFIEYEFPKGKSLLFNDVAKKDIIKLNSCRAGIYHAICCYNVKKVWIARYQCDEVINFLQSQGIEILFYDIDEKFMPIFKEETNSNDSAIVLSNYFGILGKKHFEPLTKRFNNIIIDNAQALFFPPIDGCINCYSPRKFVCAPDGSYVIGKDVNKFVYEQDKSSNTCQFLFMRQEYGCDNHAYSFKKENDKRLNSAGIKLMSSLTSKMLNAVNYDDVVLKRKNNFEYARKLFDSINKIDIGSFIEDDCVPMGYPLLTDYEIIPEFHKQHIYQPRYWEYMIEAFKTDSLEYKLAKYMALICIDQRYGKNEIDYQFDIVKELNKKI